MNIITEIDQVADNQLIDAAEKMSAALSILNTDTEIRGENFITTLTPYFAQIISQGVQEGIFDTDRPYEYAEMLLIMRQHLSNTGTLYSEKAEVFISSIEELLGGELGIITYNR